MTDNIDSIFYELLQIAIGTRAQLSKKTSAKEWQQLFELSKKQALTAVAFYGVSKLKEAYPDDNGIGSSIGMPETLYLQWMGLTAKIVQRNWKMNTECSEVCKELAHDGFRCCVLKGQGNQEYYPENLQEYRTAGDIDVWCDPYDSIAIAVGSDKGAEYVEYYGINAIVEYTLMRANIQRKNGNDGWYELGYHHACYMLPSGIKVELHSRPSWLPSPVRNYTMQRWFKKQMDTQLPGKDYNGFPVPSVGFNVVFQLTHIFNHLMEEGVGLRQLLDYYMVLRMYHNDLSDLSDHCQSMGQWAENMGRSLPSCDEVMHTLSSFGLKKFACALMWVLHEVFAMPECYMICPANEREGRFLLDEIMAAGNFGQYDVRINKLHSKSGISRKIGQLKHALRLLNHYPEETLCTPFRIYHVIWRKFELWRY